MGAWLETAKTTTLVHPAPPGWLVRQHRGGVYAEHLKVATVDFSPLCVAIGHGIFHSRSTRAAGLSRQCNDWPDDWRCHMGGFTAVESQSYPHVDCRFPARHLGSLIGEAFLRLLFGLLLQVIHKIVPRIWSSEVELATSPTTPTRIVILGGGFAGILPSVVRSFAR